MLGLNLGLGLSAQRASFSPLSLNPVLLVDPSDTSTLFQDIAGTTPVTSAGDPVGLALSKDQGLRLGPELTLIGESGATWDAPTKTATWLDGTYSNIRWTASVGEVFKIEGEIADPGSGQSTVQLRENDGTNYPLIYEGGVGTFSAFIRIGEGSNGNIYTGGPGYQSTVVTNLKVRKVLGNHLAAPSNAARPVYQKGWDGIGPLGSELTSNPNFDTDVSGWTLQSGGTSSITWDAGEMVLDRGDQGSCIAYTSVAVTPGEVYRVAVGKTSGVSIVKIGAGINTSTYYNGANDGNDAAVDVVPTSSPMYITLLNNQPTTAKVDSVSAKPVPAAHTLHWLQFDGVDDQMETAGVLPFSTEVFNATAYRVTSWTTSYPHVVEHRGSGLTADKRQPIIFLSQPGNSVGANLAQNRAQQVPGGVLGNDIVTSLWASGTNREVIDNGVIWTDPAAPVLSDGGTEPFKIGGSKRFAGRFYGTVQANAVPAASQIAATRAFFARKSGGVA